MKSYKSSNAFCRFSQRSRWWLNLSVRPSITHRSCCRSSLNMALKRSSTAMSTVRPKMVWSKFLGPAWGASSKWTAPLYAGCSSNPNHRHLPFVHTLQPWQWRAIFSPHGSPARLFIRLWYGPGGISCWKKILWNTRNLLRAEKSVFRSARAVNLGAGLLWDVLPERTVCMQA